MASLAVSVDEDDLADEVDLVAEEEVREVAEQGINNG